VHAEDKLDAVAAQHLAERLAQRRGLAGEHVPGALDQRHLAAQAAHGLRHLDADRPPAEYQQAARDGQERLALLSERRSAESACLTYRQPATTIVFDEAPEADEAIRRMADWVRPKLGL